MQIENDTDLSLLTESTITVDKRREYVSSCMFDMDKAIGRGGSIDEPRIKRIDFMEDKIAVEYLAQFVNETMISIYCYVG